MTLASSSAGRSLTDSDPFAKPALGCEAFGYHADDRWAQLPADWSFGEAVGVATDRQDRVYVFNRGEHPMIIFDREGRFLGSWGEGVFSRPHGILIGPDDAVYCTDDFGHCVKKLTLDGRLLLTLGIPGQPSDTGATSLDFRTIRQAAGPFHYPTNVALAPNGDIYVTDGYGNACVHKFSSDGRLLCSWGEPGNGPGQFGIPHGIAVDSAGVVYVADRENSRIQRFSPAGEFLSEWTGIARPCEIFFDASGNAYVAELGYCAGMWSGTSPTVPDATGGRVSIFDPQGRRTACWGGGSNPCAPGDFFAPHDIWVDRHGDIYVSEVVLSGGANRGLVSADCHTLQKFVRT